MMTFLKTTVAAAALAGAALFASSPAQAGVSLSFSIGIPNAIGFDYDSGGYCDDWGCPDEYWDMPVYYGPVYYRGHWFQGPVYYRDYRGTRWYWIRGAWRLDEWRGPRPHWWKGNYRYGPALGYNFYLRNGFRHDRDRYWRGNDWRPGRDWDRNRWKNWDRDHGKIKFDERRDNDRHDNDRGNNRWPFGGGGKDKDNDHGGKDHDGGGSHAGGGSMTGPGGGGSHGGGSMMGPGGGGMMGPGGGNSGGSKNHNSGGSMTGPGGGGMMGPGGGSGGGNNSSGDTDKPKHKKHGDKPDNGN